MAEPKRCPACGEKNNPTFTQCWKCNALLMASGNLSQQYKIQLTPIPRVASRAPKKNTIEWEIPEKVLVGIMKIDRIGYMVFVKVKVAKKHWWEQSWENRSARDESNAGMALLQVMPFLEQYGYTIDPNSMQFGEKIGEPEYFKELAGQELLDRIPFATVEEVTNAIENDVDIDYEDDNGVTPLIHAAMTTTNPEVIETLIRAGADVAHKNVERMTALLAAASNNPNPEIIKTLIQSGAKVDDRCDKGRTALMYAASKDTDLEIFKILLQSGAKVDDRDFEGWTALLHAAMTTSDPEVIKILIEHGANVNDRSDKNRTPAMLAALNHNPAILKALIQSGADVKVKANDGMTTIGNAEKNPQISGTDLYQKLKSLIEKE